MSLTARQLNRATLQRQLLLSRAELSVPDAVRHLVGLQAQEAASPYLALWNRLAGFEAADLDTLFADRGVVKASLMRLTLHAVHIEDYPALHAVMTPNLRASRLHDARFAESGLTVAEADALLPGLDEFALTPRTAGEIEKYLETALGEPRERVWWALRTFARLHHAPTGGPWSFKTGRASFVAAGGEPSSAEEGLRELVLRYLGAFGPASVADVAQFTLLGRPLIRQELARLGERVRRVEGPGGTELFDLAGGEVPDEATPAPARLLGMWDNVLLAYADRARIIPAEFRPAVIQRNGDVLPTLLVDGYVAGVWRVVEGGIEATAFRPLSEAEWAGLAVEAAALTAFFSGRDPALYRRFGHWWVKGLPGVDVRVLPG
ncbi:winged helix DNA-binding domain-containing protein [Nonomuraea sp. NPDC050310]|uniref:winged helix DNA-binding domain-containing protein n=1 Tax=unclassified Nonomuraea TaxID=2593643 RepID=UPI0033E5F59A